MEIFTAKQLEMAKQFVVSLKDEPDDEISNIIAGMTAIIDSNEKSYEWLKNQKWFERIWFGLTLKNKATVKEMHANRDRLSKYIVRMLVMMNDILNRHSNCIHDLYRAIAVVRRDMGDFVDEVNHLAVKLNEKIISVDNYNYVITEIQNKKFNPNTPILSLIDIMSLLDKGTVEEPKRLTQLKETMENVGFDFSKKIEISALSKEFASLTERGVGSIFLFCRNFAETNSLFKNICSYIENYYFCENDGFRSDSLSNNTPDYPVLPGKGEIVIDELFHL